MKKLMSPQKSNSPEGASDREIVITRVFDAPRELVWEAMTNPQHVANWWGPRGFTTTTEVMDLRPGGAWKHVMRGPDGANYPNKSIFKEVVKPERIVYSHGGGREDGPGASFVATWSFEVVEKNKTRLTARMVFPTADQRDFVVKEFGAIEGGKQTLERLSEFLANQGVGTKPFVISREFVAPRALVFKVWTERDHLVRWWGPKGMQVVTCKNDLRPGGMMHYCLRTPDGHDMWGRWVYRDVIPPDRLVFVGSFSDEQGGLTRHPMAPAWPLELLSTIKFTENAGRTTVTVTWVPLNPTEAERKAFDGGHTSMQGGWGGTLDQLGEYLAKVSL
jgi:uncharacterized protein YndB with AHSA1/START domain